MSYIPKKVQKLFIFVLIISTYSNCRLVPVTLGLGQEDKDRDFHEISDTAVFIDDINEPALPEEITVPITNGLQQDDEDRDFRRTSDIAISLDDIHEPGLPEEITDIWLNKETVTEQLRKSQEQNEKQKTRQKLLQILAEIKKHKRKQIKKGKKTDNKMLLIQDRLNKTRSHGIRKSKKKVNWGLAVFDHRLWVGLGIGATVSMATIFFGLMVFNFIQRYRRRNYCVDLNNLSLCNKNKDPVYVRLSQLHNQKQGAQYIVSVMDQSNNFSICSEKSSSEEEIFDISDIKRMQSPKKSMSKISMTSTPVKEPPTHIQDHLGTPVRTRMASCYTSPTASPIVRPPCVASPMASPIVKAKD